MKILYVFGSSDATYITDALRKLNYDVMEYPETHLMSIHLIYNIAVAAYWSGIKYVPVIWDAPYLKSYTVMGTLDNIWYSVFDKLDAERMRKGGCPHVLYQPLSVNSDREATGNNGAISEREYIHDISFIANLYEKNEYDRCLDLIPPNIQEYFCSIFEEAAFKWDGVNRIYGKTGSEILQYMQKINPEFRIPNNQDIADIRIFENYYLIRKAANIERIGVLNLLAETHAVKFYTNSQAAGKMLVNVDLGPSVLYGRATSMVYAGSRINLNISLKGIEGGTPLRIMDIMGAGGFVLTTYCTETAELFE